MTPNFRSGQTVLLNRNLPYRWAAGGEYKVTRQLPESGGELPIHHQKRARTA
jgi:hypothetical protein